MVAVAVVVAVAVAVVVMIMSSRKSTTKVVVGEKENIPSGFT